MLSAAGHHVTHIKDIYNKIINSLKRNLTQNLNPTMKALLFSQGASEMR